MFFKKRKQDKLLSIGSVVLLKGARRKLMIFGRVMSCDTTKKNYDYVGVPYPEGNISKDYTYLFNHKEVVEVLHQGLIDEEEDAFREQLEKIR